MNQSLVSISAPRTVVGAPVTNEMMRQHLLSKDEGANLLDTFIDYCRDEYSLDQMIADPALLNQVQLRVDGQKIDASTQKVIVDHIIDHLIATIHRHDAMVFHPFTPHLKVYIYAVSHDGHELGPWIDFLVKHDFFANTVTLPA